jgi:hypothetical protein
MIASLLMGRVKRKRRLRIGGVAGFAIGRRVSAGIYRDRGGNEGELED